MPILWLGSGNSTLRDEIPWNLWMSVVNRCIFCHRLAEKTQPQRTDNPKMFACWRVCPAFPSSVSNARFRCGFCCRAGDQVVSLTERKSNKKVIIVGSGWAGLGAAHHLCKQGFDVTVLEGGYDFGPKNKSLSPDDTGIRGFYYPCKNIFNLVDELGIKPFTSWTKSAQYSEEGLEVEYPIFQDVQQLPTPFGTLFNTQFVRLPFFDRLTSLPLVTAAIDFDNTDAAWRKYDRVTAREMLKQFGCSERLYQDVFNPLIQVGLYAPAEQSSAAATLGLLYYFVLANQKHLDMVLCRGTVGEKIFQPWMDFLISQGCRFLEGRKVTDILLNEETGCISQLICEKESFKADAFILAVGVSTLQEIIYSSAVLCTREDFLKIMNLKSIDLLTVKIQLDRKVNIPYASNVSSGFDGSCAWTFFDLSIHYDELKGSTSTVIETDFYHANDLLPLKDDKIIEKVMFWLSKCVKDFENAMVIDREIGRFPKILTHYFPGNIWKVLSLANFFHTSFSPAKSVKTQYLASCFSMETPSLEMMCLGSYKYMMRGSTSLPNLFMAGDWIINRHGSWSQEKSYVTGLEAANRVVDYLEEGAFAKIIPLEEDEPHIQSLRLLNRNLNGIRDQLPFSKYFLQ